MSLIEKLTERPGSDWAKIVIKDYMRKHNMDTIEEFKKENPNLESFAHNTRYENSVPSIISRWKSFRETEFQELLDELQKEEDEKRKLDTNNISTTIVNGHEISTVKDEKTGKQVSFDNTYTNRDISDQMQDIQNEHREFQSIKEEDSNTAGVMDYMEDNVKITPDVIESTELETSNNTNSEEEQIMIAVKGLEAELGYPVEVDLNAKIIYDRVDGTIYSIEQRDGVYQIIPQNTELENTEEKKEDKGPSLALKIAKDSGRIS